MNNSRVERPVAMERLSALTALVALAAAVVLVWWRRRVGGS